MTAGTALTVIEIVALTISVLFVLTQLLISAVADGRLTDPSEVFVSLLYAVVALVGASTAAGVYAVGELSGYLVAAVGLLLIAIAVIGYASAVAILQISDDLGVSLFPSLQEFGDIEED